MENRKLSILKAVINSYIDTGCAVGSDKLSKGFDFGVSPATIRGDLALLEQEGYLTHQHTSAGRVPTDKGYRYYVDHFLNTDQQSNPTYAALQVLRIYKDVFNDISLILSRTADVLSEITNCFCMVSMQDLSRSSIKMIKLILLNVHQVLVILLMNAGVSKDYVLNIDDGLDEGMIDRISYLLTQTLKDKTFNEISEQNFTEMVRQIPDHRQLVSQLYHSIKSTVQLLQAEPEIYKKGTSKLMKYNHDFSGIEEMTHIIELLEAENELAQLLIQSKDDSSRVNFVIGDEMIDDRLKNCAVGKIKYNFFQNQGDVIVLGPRRLRYAEVSNVLNSAAQSLDTLIKNEPGMGGEQINV